MSDTFEKLGRLFDQFRQPERSIIQRTCWGCGAAFAANDIGQRWCTASCKVKNKKGAGVQKADTRRKFNYQAYLLSEDWRRKAEAAKKRAGYRCQVCNRDRSEVLQLEAHHRTYEYLGEERAADLTVLCNECHDLFSKHGKLAKVPR